MRGASCLLALGLFLVTGCSTVPWQVACKGDGWPALPGEEPKEPPKSALPILFTNGQCYRYRIIEKTPKTLLEWQLCKGDEKNDDKEQEKNGNGKNSKNSDAEKKANGEKKGDAEKKGDEKKNGNGSKKWEIEYEEPLATDFPDFGVASTNVPRGRVMLETVFDFYSDRTKDENFSGHSLPNALLHIGITDWFEFRIGQTYSNFRTTPLGGRPDGIGVLDSKRESGFNDLYLGVRFALTEQAKIFPESILLIQATVPTGAKELTANEVLPGFIYLFSWAIGESPWSISGLFEMDKAVDDSRQFYAQFAQTFEVKYQVTKRFSVFAEGVALYPLGARSPDITSQFYVNPGFIYWISNNIQVHAHVFIGLNREAIDYFGGPGVAFRY